MKKIALLLLQGEDYFDSGSQNSKQFNTFFLEFQRAFKKELHTINAELISISKSHFCLSGFFKNSSGKLYYFSLNDVRSPIETMLYRTARDLKDYTGGSNQWVTIGEGMARNMNITQ